MSHKSVLHLSTSYSLHCCCTYLGHRPLSPSSLWYFPLSLPYLYSVSLSIIFHLEVKLNLFKSINQNMELLASNPLGFPIEQKWNSRVCTGYMVLRGQDPAFHSGLPWYCSLLHLLCSGDVAISFFPTLRTTSSLPYLFLLMGSPLTEFSSFRLQI